MTHKTPQEYAAFLESLRVKNEGPDKCRKFRNWRYDRQLPEIWSDHIGYDEESAFINYLLERCRRAEANAKPSTLVEDVKAFVRAGMKAAYDAGFEYGKYDAIEDHQSYDKFSELSEPSK